MPSHFLCSFRPCICRLPLCGYSSVGELISWHTVRKSCITPGIGIFNFQSTDGKTFLSRSLNKHAECLLFSQTYILCLRLDNIHILCYTYFVIDFCALPFGLRWFIHIAHVVKFVFSVSRITMLYA